MTWPAFIALALALPPAIGWTWLLAERWAERRDDELFREHQHRIVGAIEEQL